MSVQQNEKREWTGRTHRCTNHRRKEGVIKEENTFNNYLTPLCYHLISFFRYIYLPNPFLPSISPFFIFLTQTINQGRKHLIANYLWTLSYDLISFSLPLYFRRSFPSLHSHLHSAGNTNNRWRRVYQWRNIWIGAQRWNEDKTGKIHM